MNNYKALLLAVVFIFPWTIAVEAQKEDAAKDEMKKLQGVWQVTKWFDPDPAPEDEVKSVTFEFKNDQIIKRTDGRAREPLKVVLNPAKKPKWLDLDAGIEVMQGIYKLEGDELTFCVIAGSSSNQVPERPADFKANKKKHHVLFVMKKIKN